jgi:SSS family solute:Na+ symporter
MLNWFDTSLIVCYLAALLVIALLGLRRSEISRENLILAGRRLTLPAFVATLVSTWYGGILGVGEFSYRHGLSNWVVFGVPYYIAAAIFALFLVKRARQSPDMTIPERLFRSYGAPASVAGSIVLFIVTMPMAYVLMVGVMFNLFFGMPVWAGIILGTFFSVCYVVTGGFKADVLTDIIQFILMFVGFFVLLVFAYFTLGDLQYLQAAVPASHFSLTGGNRVGYIAFWYVVALATLVEPAFYQRCFAAKSASTAQRGILISILFWMFFDFMTTASGMYARALMPDLTDPVTAYPMLAQKILPVGLTGLFYLSLLATVMSTVDSYLFLAATTISHDLIWRFKRFDESRMRFYTGIGLVVTSVGAVTVAMLSESVVNIWHDFGSIGMPALLLPMMTSYWGKYQYSPAGATISIVVSGLVSSAALIYPRISASGEYFLNIEPIFVGLAASIIVFALTRAEKPVNRPA